MRLDRFITLCLARPLLAAIRPLSSAVGHRFSAPHLPILMYHSISDDPELGAHPYYRVCTSPKRFCEQMQWLKNHGYRGVTLSEGLTWLQSSAPKPPPSDNSGPLTVVGSPWPVGSATPSPGLHPPSSVDSNPPCAVGSPSSEKLVALTFDDGFRNFYTQAFPVLQERGFTATVFLPTAFIGEPRRTFRSPTLPTGRECLTWPEVQELAHQGTEFGSHTSSHPKLVQLSWSDIRAEVSSSKAQIEQHLEQPVTTFCYPYAFPQANKRFCKQFRGILADAGYACCATTQLGRLKAGDDPYRLKRLPANSLDNPEFLEAKLEGSYDWLACPQALVKTLKRV